jgi:hypothetical protein
MPGADYAIYTCFANDRNQQERQDQRDRLDEAEMFQPRAWVAELSDSIDWIRRNATRMQPPDRWRQDSSAPAGAPDRRRRPGSAKVMSTG